MIKGLYETHLYVSNLERSAAFYKNVLQLEVCHKDEKRNVIFFWIGAPRKSMLGLWQKPKSEVQSRHFAFECEPAWILNNAVSFLQRHHLPCYNFLNDGSEEPMVFAWMPAVSIYFNDPDGHVLEFIGILKDDPIPEAGIVSYKEWINISAGH